MYHLRPFQLRVMAACGSALRRQGIGATTIEEVANRLARRLYTSLTIPQPGKPAGGLVRLFKTTPYGLLTPDLFRVIPLGRPEDLERLPMFSQLFHRLGLNLPHLSRPAVRQDLQQKVAAKGMDCLGVRNGREAVELAQTATLLKQNPATAAMRLVILTIVGRRGDGSTARMLGIDAYLTKPLRQPQMLECFCQLVDDKTTATATDSASDVPPPLITRHTSSPSQTAAPPRLLLAEDNPVNQKVACKMLEKLGYRVDVASNGQEAVAAHERAPYPLIFMDCQMPEVDGFEATALIRKMEGRSAHTPIVAMTANAMQGDRERCLAAGMDDYVAKPIRSKDLQAVLDTWLGNTATRTGITG